MILIYSTFPKKKTAERISSILIREKLIACANIFPIRSIYRWGGATEKTSEVGTIFKTTKKLSKSAKSRLLELHPYKVPAILEISAKENEEYRKWVKMSVQ